MAERTISIISNERGARISGCDVADSLSKFLEDIGGSTTESFTDAEANRSLMRSLLQTLVETCLCATTPAGETKITIGVEESYVGFRAKVLFAYKLKEKETNFLRPTSASIANEVPNHTYYGLKVEVVVLKYGTREFGETDKLTWSSTVNSVTLTGSTRIHPVRGATLLLTSIRGTLLATILAESLVLQQQQQQLQTGRIPGLGGVPVVGLLPQNSTYPYGYGPLLQKPHQLATSRPTYHVAVQPINHQGAYAQPFYTPRF